MLDIILSAVSLTVFSLFYKIANRKNYNLLSINACMLAGGAIFGSILFLWRGNFMFPGWVWLIGALAGLCLFVSTITFFFVIKHGRLIISWAVISLSIIIPTIFSIFLWGEMPDMNRGIGIITSFAALILLGFDRRKSGVKKALLDCRNQWVILLIISFLATGLIMTFGKALLEWGRGAYALEYMFIYQTAGFLASFFIISREKRVIAKREIIPGAIMGVSGFFAYFFLLQGLNALPGIIVFPARSALNLSLTAILSIIIWEEKIGPWGALGIMTAIISIVLIR